MKKLWILALLPLLFVFGCNTTTIEDTTVVEKQAPENNYLSENIECQKLMDQFKSERPEFDSNIYRSNYSVFYSPVNSSCFGAFSQSYKNLFCYRIFDIFNSATEYTYCYDLDKNRTYSHIDWGIEEITWYYEWSNVQYLRSEKIEFLKKASQ